MSIAGCAPSTTTDDAGAADAGTTDARPSDAGHDTAPAFGHDAFAGDAAYDCTPEPTGTACGDAGGSTCPTDYACTFGRCIPNDRACGPSPGRPCGISMPYSLSWSETPGFHAIGDCYCFTDLEAHCLAAAGGGWSF